MKKFLFFAAVFLISFVVIAQPPLFEWSRPLGGSSDESGTAITVDAAGNVYSTGNFSGTVDFDPGPGVFALSSSGNSGCDAFVSKLDVNGNLLWALKIGGPGVEEGEAITIDKQGDLLISGNFMDGADFDPGAGTFTLSGLGMRQAFVLKLSNQGNLIWAKKFASLNSNTSSYGRSVAADASGDMYVVGQFVGTVDFDPSVVTSSVTSGGGGTGVDAYICKLSSNGAYMWMRRFIATDYEAAESVAIGNNGEIYVAGNFRGTADFDPGSSTFNLSSSTPSFLDVFIVRFNSTGNFIWAAAIGGPDNDLNHGVAVDNSNEVILSGSFNGTADLDPTQNSLLLTSAGLEDAYVVKLQASGAFVWGKQIGGPGSDIAYSIDTDLSGSVYLGGTFLGTADFDPNAGTYTISSFSQGQDAFISKLNAAGNFEWAAQLGGISQEIVYGLAIDTAMNVHSTGLFYGIGDFDPAATTYTMSNAGLMDAFVHKLSACVIPANAVNITPASQLGICSGATTTLLASGTGTINWYNFLTGGSPIATGPLYVTPSLSIGFHAYYAEVITCTNSAVRSAFNVTVDPVVTAAVTRSVICKGESSEVQAYGSSNFNWSNGGTGSFVSVSPTITTNYITTGINNSMFCANSATVTVTVSTCAGLNELSGEQHLFEIFPNPSGDLVFIRAVSSLSAGVQVYDARGQMLMDQHAENGETALHINHLSKGIYFIRCGNTVKKLVKE